MPSLLSFIGDSLLAPRDVGFALPGGAHSVFVGNAGGAFVPGAYLDQLVRAHEQGTLRGAAGLWFGHQAVVGVASNTRGALAALLQHLFANRTFFVMDELSVEWAAHYGLSARLGGHPGWLSRVTPGALLAPGEKMAVVVTVQAAFRAALLGVPMLLFPQADGGPGCAAQDSYSPLRRWAATYGMLDALCATQAEVDERLTSAPHFPAERLAQEQQRARDTLQELLLPPAPRVSQVVTFEPVTEVDGELAAALAQALDGPRVIEPGTVFDPQTHYDKNYYAGPEGKGLRYMQPNGTWTTYYGPAKQWDGNKVIARTLTRIMPRGLGRTHMDIGCGAGDFVNQMRALDWNSAGIDISEAATKDNPHVLCGDFAKQGMLQHEAYDFVTALDFWEHIFLRDLDPLIDATRALLHPGGLHFAIICTRGAAERDFVAEPGATFTRENSWLLVSGHVNVRDWSWWAHTFRRHGFKLRYDIAYLFQVLRNEDPGLSTVKSWQAKNLLVLERK